MCSRPVVRAISHRHLMEFVAVYRQCSFPFPFSYLLRASSDVGLCLRREMRTQTQTHTHSPIPLCKYLSAASSRFFNSSFVAHPNGTNRMPSERAACLNRFEEAFAYLSHPCQSLYFTIVYISKLFTLLFGSGGTTDHCDPLFST